VLYPAIDPVARRRGDRLRGRLVLAAAGGYRYGIDFGAAGIDYRLGGNAWQEKELRPAAHLSVGGSLLGCRAEARRVFQVVDKRFRTLGRQQCQIIQAGIDVALPHLAR
jgi:hypothetical protein